MLFMSGFTDRDFALDAEAPRRERFLAKPFTVPDLVAQVRELLAEAAPRKA